VILVLDVHSRWRKEPPVGLSISRIDDLARRAVQQLLIYFAHAVIVSALVVLTVARRCHSQPFDEGGSSAVPMGRASPEPAIRYLPAATDTGTRTTR
jgi:hypothetical protein